MAAADAFVPSSKHLIELVTRRCQGIPVLDTKEFMLEVSACAGERCLSAVR